MSKFSTVRSKKALLGIQTVVAGLSVVLTLLVLQTDHSPLEPLAFGLGAIVTVFLTYLIYSDRAAGWGYGLLWIGIFVWFQFWYTAFSEGSLGSTFLALLNVLTGTSVLALSVLMTNKNYYWPAFYSERPAMWYVGVWAMGLAGILAGLLLSGTVYSLDWYLLGDLLLTGLGQGSLYALPTIGFVLIYKTTDILNFSQGILIVLGAFSVIIFTDWGFPIGVSLALTVVLAIVLGLTLERFIFRNFIGEPELSVVLVTIALISVIGGITQGLVGGRLFFGYPDALLFESVSLPLGYTIRGSFALGIVTSIVVLALLLAFFKYTVLGAALRATAADEKAAMLLGISSSQTTKIAWILSILITMVGGILLAISLGGATFQFEILIVLIFAAAIFGGLDSLLGAYIGSLAVGVLEMLGGFYFTPVYGSGFAPVLPMVFLLAVIIVKPYGLFGTERIERL